MSLLNKIEVLLEGYDVPEFYFKEKPAARTIIEGLTKEGIVWHKTKRMKRHALNQLRDLAECNTRMTNKLWEAIYEAVHNHGKRVLEMPDGDEIEQINEDK